ncbi:MAG: hypothetical protein ACJ0J7_05855 [Tepidiformaceae bacterium]
MVGANQASLSDSQHGLPLRHKAVFAGILFVVGLTSYVSFQPSQIWILLLTAGIALFASFSSDLRENNSILDKTTSAVLPVMGIFASGLFIQTQLSGYESIVFSLAAGFIGGLIIFLQGKASIKNLKWQSQIRFLFLLLIYPIAFSFFHYIEDLEMQLPLTSVACGLVVFILGFEIYRMRANNDYALFLLCLVSAFTIIQLRLVLFFFPIDPLFLSALILIGFYAATGLIARFDSNGRKVLAVLEYSVITAVAVAALFIFWA